MVVPRKRTTKSAQGQRRIHLKLRKMGLVACSNCGELKMPHKLCKNCGK